MTFPSRSRTFRKKGIFLRVPRGFEILPFQLCRNRAKKWKGKVIDPVNTRMSLRVKLRKRVNGKDQYRL